MDSYAMKLSASITGVMVRVLVYEVADDEKS